MSTAGKNKNGSSTQQVTANVPWTDKQGIGEKVYDAILLIFEIIVLNIRMLWAWIEAFYELVVPGEPKDVSKEIVLITGAGHGMGREMSLQFASLGATVICVDINAAGNKETAEMIKQAKGKVHTYECDVTNRAAVFQLAEKVRAAAGDVTMLVNNAGIMPCRPFLFHTEEEVRRLFEINCIAHVWTTQAFLPAMLARNHGHIVAMSSMAGQLGLRNLVPYCGTKFAVRGFMEALHEELREDKRDFSGIKFSTIYPYIVDTGLCKNPKIKFPSMMKVVTPKEAATIIVKAVRHNRLETTIPESLYYVGKICRVMPQKVPILLKDFLDSGLESHHEPQNKF